MTARPGPAPADWVPVEACTLPTAEQPLRVAEFDDSVRRVAARRRAPGGRGDPGPAGAGRRRGTCPAGCSGWPTPRPRAARSSPSRSPALDRPTADGRDRGGPGRRGARRPRRRARRPGAARRSRPAGDRVSAAARAAPGEGAGLRSGQVAAAAGVNIETLRYYERRGLLAEPRPQPRRAPPVRRAETSPCCGSSRPRSGSGSPSRRSPSCSRSAGTTTGRHGAAVPATPACRQRARAKLAEVEERIADLRHHPRHPARGARRRLRRPGRVRRQRLLPHPVRHHHHPARRRAPTNRSDA